ncbi:hypothetical protein [Coprobacter sp.]|uniref:hypothetical protein n=1 Tax=Coprobacter sp. TaxID=1941478 RepID=UPI003AB1E0EF
MATKKLTNEFMEKILNDSAWKELSENFAWTEQMLEKFKKLIDWQELSSTGCETILTEDCLEQFKDYWDWSKLSYNNNIELDYQLIDRFIDQWDWSELINRWRNDKLYNIDFLERYADKIPSSQPQDSHLWRELVEERAKELKLEVIA